MPNDIRTDNQIIPAKHLKTQKHINSIQNWTENKKINKTKAMIFNFSNTYKFTTRLKPKNKNIKTVKSTKLLGTLITDDLKRHDNTKHIVKKAWGRMQLLRKVV